MTTGTMVNTVLAFLAQEGWTVEVSTSGIVRTRYEGKNADFDCYVQPFEDDDQLIVMSVLGSAEPERRRDMAELASRINLLLRIGGFEVDFDDGELRHRAGIPVPEAGLDEGMIAAVVYASVLPADQYASAFVSVASGRADPVAALEVLRDDVNDANDS